MASGRLGAYDLLENIPQSIYVCPTDDLASATVNVVNRRTDYANVTLAITDAPNIITDTDAYLEIEVPIPPKGVMERTQVMIPSGKYLTVKSDKKFVNVTAWGATVGLLSDPQPDPIPVSATNFVTDGGFDAGDFSAYTVTNSGGGFLQVINGAAVLQDTTGTTSISQTFTVTQGTLVNYQFDVTSSDFTTQTVTVTNGATPITVNVNSTGTYKGQFIAESTSVTITLAVSTGQIGYDNIYVWDNAEVAPTYILSLDDTSYNEDATITATLSTTNVPDGRTVDYTVTGIDANDIASGNLTGTLTVSSGTATVAWTLAEDATTEGNELFTITLDAVDSIGLPTNSSSASSVVVDTSLTPFPIPLYNPANPVPSNSFFGSQVATSGIYTAVRYNNQSYSDSRIPIYNSTNGSFLREITAPEAGEFASRMAAYGTYLFTCITDEKAYVYDMSTGNQVHEFTNPNPAGTTSFDFYGRGLSIDNRYAVVGAPAEDVGSSGTGSVYVYDMTNGNLLYRLDGTGGSFGDSTAIAGDYLIVGAWSALDGGGFSQGEAYVYDIADGTPVRTISTIDTDATPNDQFARNIQANSSYIVISASGADDDGTNSGRVYVYDTTTGNLLHTLTNPNRLGTVDNDQFGSVLSLNGDLLAVGSADGGSASGNGTVYLFDLSGPTITYRQIANPDLLDTATTDYFGFETGTVYLSSTHLVIGAPRAESATIANEGNAFIYNLPQVLSDITPTNV